MSVPFRFLLLFTLGGATCLAAVPPAASRAVAVPTTAEFQARLIEDLRAGVRRSHQDLVRARQSPKKRPDRGYSWTLSAMVNLHRRTGEAQLLAWTKEDLLWMVDNSRNAAGEAVPLLTSFRNVAPFCEAFEYLVRQGLLDEAEKSRVAAQLAASMATHYGYTDFGPQNRGLIDGIGFLYAARVAPDARDAALWVRYGKALVADSLNAWSMEDASIYQPFWLTYSLVLAELEGREREHLGKITTRFYFEHTQQLQMPNGLLPDWGDGDWTHNWAWSVANLVRAGSHGHEGRYLETARRLYEASTAFWGGVSGDSLYCIGLAVRWLDPAVAFEPFRQDQSHEVVDDLVSKKITFRGARGAYTLLNYRDEGPYARHARDYLNAELDAYQEKPHHGHADENSIAALVADGTVLLADGGYRSSPDRGWRADVYHNRIVARTGRPYPGDLFDYLKQDIAYHAVQTEKIHFGNFGSLDYSRTRLVDAERGYTGDRIILFAPESGLHIVVDSLLIDVAGPKIFGNLWHPDQVRSKGDNYVVSWPERIPVRTESWPNPHTQDLLIQFLGNRDKLTETKEIERRYNRSTAFYQTLNAYFFKGQRLLFVTVLRPHAAGTFSPEMLADVQLMPTEHDDNRTLGLTFSLGGDKVTVGLKLDQTIGLTNLRGRPMFDFRTGAVSYGALRTDADFAFVRQHQDGRREVGLMYGSAVEFGGETLFDLPLNGDQMYQGVGTFQVKEIKDKMPRDHFMVPARPVTGK